MKKIITAINNPKLNEKLNQEDLIDVIGKDFQYKEAILEFLENDSDIDLIIISEEILGKIDLIEVISKIKKINKLIDIIFILKKHNQEVESILKEEGVKKICFADQMSIHSLVEHILEKELDPDDLKKEILKLKKIIELNNSIKENKECGVVSDCVDKYEGKECENEKISDKYIILITGDRKVGKTKIAKMMFEYLKNMKRRVCIVDMSCTMNLNISFKIENKSLMREGNAIILNEKNNIINKEYLNIKDYLIKYDYVILDYQLDNLEELIKLNNYVDKICLVIEPSIEEIGKAKKIMSKINTQDELVIINSNKSQEVCYEIIEKCFSKSIKFKNNKKSIKSILELIKIKQN